MSLLSPTFSILYNLLGVQQDSELKVGTKVSPFADTESVCVVTCQATDIT